MIDERPSTPVPTLKSGYPFFPTDGLEAIGAGSIAARAMAVRAQGSPGPKGNSDQALIRHSGAAAGGARNPGGLAKALDDPLRGYKAPPACAGMTKGTSCAVMTPSSFVIPAFAGMTAPDSR
ncbi:MAG: hypothetical protein ACYCUX_00505 [Metallibacterium sp.]